MIIESIIQTCSACPSQWEGFLVDGRMFYVRYRCGHLTIELSRKPTNDIAEAMDILNHSEQLGDGLDGILSEDRLIEIMKNKGFVFNPAI